MKTLFVPVKSVWFVIPAVCFSFLLFCQQVSAQGVLLRGNGAVNEGIGSVATATPIDAAGAIMWNPASISAFEKNEISVGLGLILPKSRVTSGFDIPGTGTAPDIHVGGSTKSVSDSVPVPSMAFVWKRCKHSPLTYGFGLAGAGGAAVLYPADPTNPVLGGLAKSSNVIVLQMTPTVSYQVTKQLSVGVAPIIDLASLQINPMQLGQTLGTEMHNYGTTYAWGGGFQIGALYDFKNHWKTGFMFKSPIWAENLRQTGTDPHTGKRLDGSFDLNLPMTLSWGVSYSGVRDTIIGLDVRYIDYGNTVGFKDSINPATGRVDGLGWDSVMAVAVGLERKINKKMKARIGYCWNENPIPGRSAALNVSAPLMVQHVLGFGATYAIVKDLEASATYSIAFKGATEGPFPVGNTGLVGTVKNESRADTLLFGITKKW
ncbi:MAG: outer membrane protein transport protein [Planctomycetaceae bacterium]|nr:outer membrane protein transport protein [Planctomycetaceae bacterium]